LIRVLESIPGSKELVVETDLMRPLDKIASMSLLQRHGCVRVQQLHMDRNIVWDDSLEYSLFLVRPTVAVARKLCEMINADPSRGYSIVVGDRRRNFFDAELERHGLHGVVEFYEFNLLLVPIESDLFSLEIPSTTAKVYRYEEQTMAKVLWQLQSMYDLLHAPPVLNRLHPFNSLIESSFQLRPDPKHIRHRGSISEGGHAV